MKELINSGDINTIYTESSCLNTDKITEILKKEGTKGIYDAQYYFGSGELSYWASNGFWDFLANKIIEGKVELVGIDIETTSDTLMKEMIAHAIKTKSAMTFFKKYPEASSKMIDDFYAVRQWYKTVEYTDSQYTVQSELIRAIISEYQKPEDEQRKKQWEVILKYLYWRKQRAIAIENAEFSSMLLSTVMISKYYSIRDSLMGTILLDHYFTRSNVKAVLITTSQHSIRKTSNPELNKLIDSNAYFLGDVLKKSLNNKVYNLCFVSSSGTIGSTFQWHNEIYKVKKPVKGSFEFFFRKSKNDFFFADLHNSSLSKKIFKMNVLFQRYSEMQWDNIFDGIFFVKKMYPVRL